MLVGRSEEGRPGGGNPRVGMDLCRDQRADAEVHHQDRAIHRAGTHGLLANDQSEGDEGG
eukprot:6723032-Heterocapsa_arctica.AAC.1